MTDTGLRSVIGPLRVPPPVLAAHRVREVLLSAGICPCNPTTPQSCRYCDGSAAEEREEYLDHLAHRRYGPPPEESPPAAELVDERPRVHVPFP